MSGTLERLARRREALVERSAAARRALADAASRLRSDAARPLALGLGAALTLAGASPRLRAWLVRAWVAGALVRRLLLR